MKLKFILKTLTLSPRYTDTKLATSVLQTETQVTQLFVLEGIFFASSLALNSKWKERKMKRERTLKKGNQCFPKINVTLMHVHFRSKLSQHRCVQVCGNFFSFPFWGL